MRLDWSPFLPHQWDAFTFVAPRTHPDEPSLSRINELGGWGSGKTHGMARVAIKFSFINGWRPEYGEDQPTGIIVAPTYRILRQSTMQQFDMLMPREAILKRRGPPHNDITLMNGFRWVLYSGEAEIEGLNACVFWVDEIQHPTFSGDGGRRFLNLMARIRDPRARAMAALTSGLPESGWVRDTLDRPDDPSSRTILAPTRANPFIPQATMAAFYDACPSGQEAHLLGGEWMKPVGAIYVQYEPEAHIRNDDHGEPNQACHLAFDIGNFGAVLVGQERFRRVRNVVGQETKAKGLHIVDQLLTNNDSVDQMCYRIKTETPWTVARGISTISLDPTARREEKNAVRNHFPDVRIVTRDKKDDYYPVESGIRQTQAALRDALGNVRLTFAPKLRGVPLGILDGLQRYRRNERTGEPVKDNLRDHVLDALRYMVCTTIPVDKPQVRVLGG